MARRKLPIPTEAQLETLTVQRRQNLRTRDEWGHFALHRSALTNAILAQASPNAQSLCLLGAGNCNDVNLEALALRFEQIHLVDLDEKGLLFAKNRQSPATRKKLRLHSRLDISGMIDRLPRLLRATVAEREVSAQCGLHADNMTSLLGKFDCVVSTCLLSQLHLTVIRVLGARHPLYELVANVTTKTHLRVLEALTATAGSALLVTDLTSNELVPAALWAELKSQFDDNQGQVQAYPYNGMLQRSLSQLASEQYTLRPCNPRVVTDVVSEDPHLNRILHSAGPELVWLWKQGPRRESLVYTFPVVRHNVARMSRARFSGSTFPC